MSGWVVVGIGSKRVAHQASHRTPPTPAAPATHPLPHANALIQQPPPTSSSPCRTLPACLHLRAFRSVSRCLQPRHVTWPPPPSHEKAHRHSPPAAATTTAD